MPFVELRETVTASIASSGNLSAAVDLSGLVAVGIQMPAAWDTANLTFQGSPDGVTYTNVYKDGAEYVVVAAISQWLILEPADFAGIRYLKVRSGTSGTPVTQTAARTLKLTVRPV